MTFYLLKFQHPDHILTSTNLLKQQLIGCSTIKTFYNALENAMQHFINLRTQLNTLLLEWRARSSWYAAQPGQGLTEYGLVIVLIAIVTAVVVGMTGQTLSRVWYDKLLTAFP
jgi:Flp pilus assembly pilin Flp